MNKKKKKSNCPIQSNKLGDSVEPISFLFFPLPSPRVRLFWLAPRMVEQRCHCQDGKKQTKTNGAQKEACAVFFFVRPLRCGKKTQSATRRTGPWHAGARVRNTHPHTQTVFKKYGKKKE
nr:hypothetical protein [Pandoravirus massiliensis]